MLDSFRELADNYSVIFFDAYGVLKNFEGVIDGVLDVLADLKSEGKELFVVTNDASRSPKKMSQQYVHKDHGELFPEDRIISSGMLARDFLRAKVRMKKVAYLGKPDSAYYIQSAGLTPIPIAECEHDTEIGAIALLDDEGFDWQSDINRALNLLRRKTMPVVVANADTVYPVRGNDVAIAVGGIADLMESALGRRFVRFGKPDAYTFSYSFSRASALTPGLRRKDILMVGDTLETDIRGGNKFGIDTLLVLTGNTARENYSFAIESSGVIPDYVCESITT
ncbi:MAG: haloacid dehalogenase [Myxococcaceae bacterium]|nr:haloacid dehalogenase [Myxococcaceae bacterium]